MAMRPVFVPIGKPPYVHAVSTGFEWSAGLSVSQKQKNIVAIHEAFIKDFPDKKVLEISTKSLQEEGVCLSAFNLKKHVPSLGLSLPLECVYHGGKVFSNGGPYTDLYNVTPKEAKKDERLQNSGKICGFYFEGEDIPAEPKTAFYTWLYINALMENPELAEPLLSYDGFTDIEFAPDKSTSCQAESAAVYVSLRRQGLLEKCKDFKSFHELIS